MFSDYGGSTSLMSTINPSDIANVSILKDAAATSLYGSRGANGVIIVTTKKGQAGQLRVNFKASTGFNDFAMNNRPILGGDETRELAYEGALNQGLFNGLSLADAQASAQENVDHYYPQRDKYSDWSEALMQTGQNSAYEVSISGGNEKTSFYTSLAYREEKGVYAGSSIGGYTGKGSVTHQDKGWTINFETLMASLDQRNISTGTAYANPYFATRYYLKPNVPIYNEDGSYHQESFDEFGLYNLVRESSLDWYSTAPFRSRNSLSVAYEFMPGLSLKETASYDFNNIESIVVWPSSSKNGEAHNGLTQRDNFQETKFYSSLLLSYDKTINDLHNLSAFVGWDVEKTNEKSLSASGKGFATDKLWELANAAEPDGVYSALNVDNLVSFFGSVNYNYNDKYYLAATYRRDGSSRLGADVKWGDFWSVSGSWRLKEEDFLSDVYWLNNLRLRASYGTSGTLPSSYYGSLSTYSFSGISYNGVSGSAPSRAANPNLTWEKNATLDIGLEARLFDTFTVELDYYSRQTKDMLLDMPLSTTTGFSSQLMNIGGLNNSGVEILVGADIFKGEFKWYSQFVAAYNRNKITSLVNHEEFAFSADSGSFMAREGYPLYSYYMRDWAGVDPGTGESMWYIWEKDQDGEYTGEKYISKDPAGATREIVGHANPDWTGGWSNTLSWKGLDLNFMLSFTQGGTSFDGGALYLSGDGTIGSGEAVIGTVQTDRWQKPGDQAKFPKRMWGGGHGNYTSTRWLHTTDHIRLKTLVFGYTVPQRLTQKASIQNLRVFVSGNNLFTWARYNDYDPEVRVNGTSDFEIPVLKSVTFGIELGF
jgi:TonB-linked SusC/RagA family outer membrane protein